MGTIDKNSISYRTEQKLRQYAREAWRDQPKSFLGFEIDMLADMIKQFREWEHTCWHGSVEHMELLWRVRLVWRVLNNLKHITDEQYWEIYQDTEKLYESIKPKGEEEQ